MTKLNLDGFTDLPRGKIATTVTYLEMRRQPEARPHPTPDGLSLQQVRAPSPDWYRTLYRRVGEDWLWFSRIVMPHGKLADIITHRDVDVFAVKRKGAEIGLLELDRRSRPDIELTFLGLVPEAVGSGAGRWLMNEAIALAFARHPARFWVHTCTLDHPGALPFYIRSGFTPYRRAIEVFDDPRLTGFLPRGAAPQIPIIE